MCHFDKIRRIGISEVITIIFLKLYNAVRRLSFKDLYETANSVDLDQTAPIGAV